MLFGNTLQSFSFEIDNNQINDVQIFINFGTFMSKLNNLKNLYLDVKYYNTIGLQGAEAISKSIRCMRNLQNLHISFCNTHGGQGNSLLLEGIGNLQNLKNLYFNCETKTGDHKYNWDCFKNQGNLQNLRIGLYNLGQGISKFAKGMSRLYNLETLNLEIFQKNQLNQDQLQFISEGLVKLENLREIKLYVEGNERRKLGIDNFFKKLFLVKNLRYLDAKLEFQELNEKEIQNIGNSLGKCNELQGLNLSFQVWYLEHGEYLIYSLEKLNRLKELDIYVQATKYQQEDWSSRHLNRIANTIRKLHNLEKLTIQDNFSFQDIYLKQDIDCQKKIESERQFLEGLGYLDKMRNLQLYMSFLNNISIQNIETLVNNVEKIRLDKLQLLNMDNIYYSSREKCSEFFQKYTDDR